MTKVSHINADGEFQSDKYPTCPPGKVPLSVYDRTAQDLLFEYARRRRSVDAEFSKDLELSLVRAGWGPIVGDSLRERIRSVATRLDSTVETALKVEFDHRMHRGRRGDDDPDGAFAIGWLTGELSRMATLLRSLEVPPAGAGSRTSEASTDHPAAAESDEVGRVLARVMAERNRLSDQVVRLTAAMAIVQQRIQKVADAARDVLENTACRQDTLESAMNDILEMSTLAMSDGVGDPDGPVVSTATVSALAAGIVEAGGTLPYQVSAGNGEADASLSPSADEGLRAIIANRDLTIDRLTTELAHMTRLEALAEQAMRSAHEASKGFQRALDREQANQWPLYSIADAARAYVGTPHVDGLVDLKRALSRAPNDAAELSDVLSPRGLTEIPDRVRELGETIGFGRLMETAEQIWVGKDPDSARSAGTAVRFLVDCPCPDNARDKNGYCEWCCGAGRVTHKVRSAISWDEGGGFANIVAERNQLQDQLDVAKHRPLEFLHSIGYRIDGDKTVLMSGPGRSEVTIQASPLVPRGLSEIPDMVREFGETIGFGRLMQTAEQMWAAKAPDGGALSVGPCVAFLVECPHPESGRDKNGHCEWCCNSGRITKRVLLAIDDEGP